MKQITEILKKVGVFYIATTDSNGDSHVRPFGAVAEIDGMTCICTSNQKKCFKEMMHHSRVEISGMCGEMEWIRLTADVVELDSDEVRAAFLEQCPQVRGLYSVGDGIFEVFELQDPECIKYSFNAPPENI